MTNNTYLLKYRILKFMYNYAISPRDMNVKFENLMETAIQCNDKLLYVQCSKELVEMQYIKSNWSEVSKKGIYFLNQINEGNLDYDDSYITTNIIIGAFIDTEAFFGRTYTRINLDEDSDTTLRTHINDRINKKTSAIQ